MSEAHPALVLSLTYLLFPTNNRYAVRYRSYFMTIPRRRHYTIITILTGVILLLCLELFYIWHTTQPVDPAPNTIPSRTYLTTEEMVITQPSQTSGSTELITPINKVLFEYVEVTGGCGTHFEGECLSVRNGPGTEYPAIERLRNGIVLKIGGQVVREDGSVWYKIVFDEWLRYPERLTDDWYVAAPYVTILYDEGDRTIWEHEYSTTSLKKIVINKTTQELRAYEDDIVVHEFLISTGLELTPTPNGTFTVFKKTPSRYMQGPIPGLADQQEYDLPGVPWNLYFTHGGAVIHGAYWHTSFGQQYSHGCVNLAPDDARTLYSWADLGTKVIVTD